MPGKMIGVSEAAEIAGIKISTARLWCAQGRFSGARKVGRDWIIPVASAEAAVRPKRGKPFKNKLASAEGAEEE
jgi:predicted site-specific integrase-resolvase